MRVLSASYVAFLLLLFCSAPARAGARPAAVKKTADPADLNGRRKNVLKMILSQKNLLVYNLVCNVSG